MMLAAGWYTEIFKEQNLVSWFPVFIRVAKQTNKLMLYIHIHKPKIRVLVITILYKNNVAQTWIGMMTNSSLPCKPLTSAHNWPDIEFYFSSFYTANVTTQNVMT